MPDRLPPPLRDRWLRWDKVRPRVLVVDDETGVRTTLSLLLEEAGFVVSAASTGCEAAALAAKLRPMLVVLDWNLPDISGLEVARLIKERPQTYHTAVILVTARTSLDDRISGLEFADDFICKPFDTNELLARAKAVVRRSQRSLGCNPLTGLPGNLAVEETIAGLIDEHRTAAVVYADLDRFKPFNDHYGYARGDDVLAFTGELLWQALNDVTGDWFLGHIGGDDFLFVLPVEHLERTAQTILQRFDEGIKTFYDKTDLEQGGLMAPDRRGGPDAPPIRYGLVSLTLAAVTHAPGSFADSQQLSQAAAEAKSQAKLHTGSHFLRVV